MLAAEDKTRCTHGFQIIALSSHSWTTTQLQRLEVPAQSGQVMVSLSQRDLTVQHHYSYLTAETTCRRQSILCHHNQISHRETEQRQSYTYAESCTHGL